MSVATFYRLESLLDRATKELQTCDAVTIDIFDTLLIRRTHDPDQVKRPVARFIADLAMAEQIDISARRVWQIRNEIEARHRIENGSQHPDHEAHYDDFMDETLREIFGDRYATDLLTRVGDYEMEIEQAFQVPRQTLVDWIRFAVDENKQCFLVSDIYLPATYLKRLVSDKGLTALFTDVISSADSFNAKASGAAYPLLKEKFSLDPERWLHIGDNPISDGVRPSQFGLKALVLRDVSEKHRKGIARSIHAKAGVSHFWRGRNTLQLMQPLEAENEDRTPLYVDGYNFFGFLLGYFTLSLLERCRKKNISHLFFCSREGWSLREYWQRAAPILSPVDPLPSTSYLYVSRLSLARASCADNGLTALSANSALLPAENRDLTDVCRVFGLDLEPLRPLIHEAGLSETDPIGPMSPGVTPKIRRAFLDLLENRAFQDEVRRQARPARQRVERYLEQEGFFEHRDVALVDVGWLGTIQHYLTSALSHRKDAPNVHGMLLGAERRMPYENHQRSNVEGLVYDRYRLDFSASLIATIKDVMEETLRAPHPTVTDYREQGQTIEPVLRRDDDEAGAAEREQDAYFQALREGMLDAAPRFAAAVKLMDYEAGQLKPWLNAMLQTRVSFPTTGEVGRIRHQSHQDDFAGQHKVPRKVRRENRTLWDRPKIALRFNPFVRLFYYFRHARRLLVNTP